MSSPVTGAGTVLREALAKALRDGGYVKGVAGRYGRFNDAYWDQSADAILAQPSMSPFTDPEQAEHEAVGRAVARLVGEVDSGRFGNIRYYQARSPETWRWTASLNDEANHWGGGSSLPEAIVAALGPSEGERT